LHSKYRIALSSAELTVQPVGKSKSGMLKSQKTACLRKTGNFEKDCFNCRSEMDLTHRFKVTGKTKEN
jgi:hypothetical protein